MTTMSMEEFVKHCRTCQGPAWFRFDVNVPSRITIPRPRAERALLGVHQAVFFRKNGKKNGDLRKFILTEETHKLLLEHDAMPLGPKEKPVRPQTRALLNVFDLGDDELKVWDMPGSVAFRLNDLNEDPDIPEVFDVILAVTKKSTGTRTIEVEYEVEVVGEAELTPEQLKACEELYDLAELIAPTPWEEIVDFLGIKDS